MARHEQMSRLLQVALTLGASQRGLPLRVLAERHGWRVRSLYRDIETLEAAGFPVLHEEGRYRLPRNWMGLTEAVLAPDERLALFLTRQLAGGLRETSVGRALDKLWARLSGARADTPLLMPAEQGHVGTRSSLAIDYSAHRRAIATIEAALAESVALRCEYLALSTGTLTARVVEPGELHWDPVLESLYLIGFCRLRQDVRVFAVHRLRMVSLTRERAVARAGTSSHDALKHAFRVWRSGTVERVSVRLSGRAAQEAAERRVHASQKLVHIGGGEVRIDLEVAGLEEVARWVLGLGDCAVVLQPTALREVVRGRLTRAAAAYDRHESVASRDIGVAQPGARRARQRKR